MPLGGLPRRQYNRGQCFTGDTLRCQLTQYAPTRAIGQIHVQYQYIGTLGKYGAHSVCLRACGAYMVSALLKRSGEHLSGALLVLYQE